MHMDYQKLREEMVSTQLIPRGIKDPRVLDAMRRVPRHLFAGDSNLRSSYDDMALPIGEGQTISQPYTVAVQTSLLQVKRRDKILEVGTGSGYQAAILAEMGAKVYSIERYRELYLKAQTTLSSLGYAADFFYGDGYEGKPQYGPYDGIIITAAADKIPDTLLEQLKIGGRLVVPLGSSRSQVMTLAVRTGEDSYDYSSHGQFVFVPLLRGTVNE